MHDNNKKMCHVNFNYVFFSVDFGDLNTFLTSFKRFFHANAVQHLLNSRKRRFTCDLVVQVL